MPIPVTPEVIPLPFAQNGQKNTIPEQGGATTDPAASWSAGFPPITMINKQAGGKPPYGMDFNGIFNALSQHVFFSQSGCVYPWMGADEETVFPGLNYLKGSHVLGSDGEEYVALQPSGPDIPASSGYVGPKDPTTDDGTYWVQSKKLYAPIATTTQAGIVKPDGMTLAVDGSGTLSASVATASQVGVVRPDGTTITINESGALSAVTAANDAPRPSAAAGVGQWASWGVKVGNALNLPPGGVWAYHAQGYNNGQGYSAATGVAAGGTLISVGTGATAVRGFAWRIA